MIYELHIFPLSIDENLYCNDVVQVFEDLERRNVDRFLLQFNLGGIALGNSQFIEAIGGHTLYAQVEGKAKSKHGSIEWILN